MTEKNCESSGEWINEPTYWACYSRTTAKGEHRYIHGEVISHCPTGCHKRILHPNQHWRALGSFVEVPVGNIHRLPVECSLPVLPDVSPILDKMQQDLARFRIDNAQI